MIMRKILTILVLAASIYAASGQQAYVPSVEKLSYKVMYKWGLISKQAGTVTLETHDFSDGYFKSTLLGRSASWADKFYSVRDTLTGTIMRESLEPVYYEKVAREGGDFKRDMIEYDRRAGEVTGVCHRWRENKKSKEITYSTVTISGTGTTLDMLSSFYYMRHIDYPSMKPGESVTTNIFSGTKKETLKITYHGIKDVEVNDRKYSCYYIKFTFTTGNGKKSSDDMQAWISTDQGRIPMLLVGNLPIGSIRCYCQSAGQ